MEQRGFRYLILSFFLALLIPEFQTECYWITTDICQYGKRKYEIGEMWKTHDCYQCSCITPKQVICCDMVNYTVDFRQHCDVWYKATTCQLSLLCDRHLKQKLKRYKKSVALYRNMFSSHSTNLLK